MPHKEHRSIRSCGGRRKWVNSEAGQNLFILLRPSKLIIIFTRLFWQTLWGGSHVKATAHMSCFAFATDMTCVQQHVSMSRVSPGPELRVETVSRWLTLIEKWQCNWVWMDWSGRGRRRELVTGHWFPLVCCALGERDVVKETTGS